MLQRCFLCVSYLLQGRIDVRKFLSGARPVRVLGLRALNAGGKRSALDLPLLATDGPFIQDTAVGGALAGGTGCAGAGCFHDLRTIVKNVVRGRRRAVRHCFETVDCPNLRKSSPISQKGKVDNGRCCSTLRTFKLPSRRSKAIEKAEQRWAGVTSPTSSSLRPLSVAVVATRRNARPNAVSVSSLSAPQRSSSCRCKRPYKYPSSPPKARLDSTS